MTQRNIAQLGQTVFTGKRFKVVQMDLPNREANTGTYCKEMVVHPGAAVILPMLDEQTVVMIQNLRAVDDEPLWELPAGTLEPPEPPESPKVTAARELIEETGYQAGQIQFLTKFYASPGISTEMMSCYLATDLTAVGQRLEPNEQIIVKVMPMDQAIKRVREGLIVDAKTVATLLYYQTFCQTINQTSRYHQSSQEE